MRNRFDYLLPFQLAPLHEGRDRRGVATDGPVSGAVIAGCWGYGKGVIDNKDSTDLDSPLPPPHICTSIQPEGNGRGEQTLDRC